MPGRQVGSGVGKYTMPRVQTIWQQKVQLSRLKKDKDRSKGKGRRCCLRDRINSIPCRASYFVPEQFCRIGWIHTFLHILLVQCILFFILSENEILNEIFCVVSRFPCYISCYIAENRLPIGTMYLATVHCKFDQHQGPKWKQSSLLCAHTPATKAHICLEYTVDVYCPSSVSHLCVW